jgi:tetratricopeptide (TPR) repeat protein
MSIASQRAKEHSPAWTVPLGEANELSQEKLQDYIKVLLRGCQEDPRSADLYTCLGMAYALNNQVYESRNCLEHAMVLDGGHFFARFKYAELHYGLRMLPRAEEETLKSIELAKNKWEISMAKRQLLQIRKLQREDARKARPRTLKTPALCLLLLCMVAGAVVLLR